MNSIRHTCLFFLGITSLFTLTGLAQPISLEVNTKNIKAKIPETLFGIFYEDINFAADGGLYAELVKNRSFEFYLPKTGWDEPGVNAYGFNPESGSSSLLKYGTDTGNQTYLRVHVSNSDGYALINEGFRGMGIKGDADYRFSILASQGNGNVTALIATLIDDDGAELGSVKIPISGELWTTYEQVITAKRTNLTARLKLTFEGDGDINLDMVSLFPTDTWKGRKNGLRKDLVTLLDEMNPGFLRFPGGCIVEGRILAERYQWKKTVGPPADRTAQINRWNTEFKHRPTPDYFQSFGLGFFEYFQLSEDLGAEPLPILGCGMACQFNTGELVPLDQLDPYIQDALDLIEFANGAVTTPWGRVRMEMGHPEPFNMKYIGIGNEQWGPEYVERLELFTRALREKYPEIQLVGSSGPFASGDFFEYGWDKMRELGVDLVDEHYYMSADWFLNNAGRYDDYPRSGPKVFAGEFAAQSINTTNPENRNNWETALSEAAFITGLERNSDLVVMTSYAPLLAHADAWQWKPDLIWFNNLEAYGTANYQVQKLFGSNSGTDLLEITSDQKPLTGQQGIYASAALDASTRELILKFVNTQTTTQEIQVDFTGDSIKRTAQLTVLRSDDLDAVNSFETPFTVAPKQETIRTQPNKLKMNLSPASVTVVRAPIN